MFIINVEEMNMVTMELPIAKMICDTAHGDGGVYFYEEHLEWRARSNPTGPNNFSIRYEDIKDVQYIPSRKKQIKITLNDGMVYSMFLYRVEQFHTILQERMARYEHKDEPIAIEVKPLPQENNDGAFAKLEKLTEMYEKNLLSEEEFKAAKAKLLGL